MSGKLLKKLIEDKCLYDYDFLVRDLNDGGWGECVYPINTECIVNGINIEDKTVTIKMY